MFFLIAFVISFVKYKIKSIKTKKIKTLENKVFLFNEGDIYSKMILSPLFSLDWYSKPEEFK